MNAALPSTTSTVIAWLRLLRICISYSHIFPFYLYSGPLQIFHTELFRSPVQSKPQIIRGLTGRPIPTDPAPSFPELPLRISTVCFPLCLPKRGSGRGYALFKDA